MRSSVKSLVHKLRRNDITWSEPILKALAVAFAAWGLGLDAWTYNSPWDRRRFSHIGGQFGAGTHYIPNERKFYGDSKNPCYQNCFHPKRCQIRHY